MSGMSNAPPKRGKSTLHQLLVDDDISYSDRAIQLFSVHDDKAFRLFVEDDASFQLFIDDSDTLRQILIESLPKRDEVIRQLQMDLVDMKNREGKFRQIRASKVMEHYQKFLRAVDHGEEILKSERTELPPPACEEVREDAAPSQAVVLKEEEVRQDEVPPQPPPPLDDLRHLLESHFPVLYAKVLEPTLADLREEHSAALAEGHPGKARWILLRGYGALAAAAVYQLGSSLLGRIAALWQARSTK